MFPLSFYGEIYVSNQGALGDALHHASQKFAITDLSVSGSEALKDGDSTMSGLQHIRKKVLIHFLKIANSMCNILLHPFLTRESWLSAYFRKRF